MERGVGCIVFVKRERDLKITDAEGSILIILLYMGICKGGI